MKLARLNQPKVMLALVAALIALERITAALFGAGESFVALGDSARLGGELGLFMLWGVGHCDTLDGPVVHEHAAHERRAHEHAH